MNTFEIYQMKCGPRCEACGGFKKKGNLFCWICYGRLPQALRTSLWKKFGEGLEQAYQACISCFRVNPIEPSFIAEKKPVQKTLFGKGDTIA